MTATARNLLSAALTLGALLSAGCANPGADAGRHVGASDAATVRADAHVTRAEASTGRARTLAEEIDHKAAILLSPK